MAEKQEIYHISIMGAPTPIILEETKETIKRISITSTVGRYGADPRILVPNPYLLTKKEVETIRKTVDNLNAGRSSKRPLTIFKLEDLSSDEVKEQLKQKPIEPKIINKKPSQIEVEAAEEEPTPKKGRPAKNVTVEPGL